MPVSRGGFNVKARCCKDTEQHQQLWLLTTDCTDDTDDNIAAAARPLSM
jgi:hypothetical protein